MSTIVALSTPIGRGALAIVRLSGAEALKIAAALSPQLQNVKPRYANFVSINEPGTKERIDKGLVTYFQGPSSVTGEDVVEISCHGSPIIVRKIIDSTLQLGARLAGPGEFTLRALANGKIDLAQAEAIRDLIAAQTETAVKQAARQVGGELSIALDPFKSKLVEVIVVLESAVEFVEDDLPPTELRTIQDALRFVRGGIANLAASYSAGRFLQDGIKVAIIGRPNVGKSSLFNRLIEFDRAIVTPIPGTTRDTLTQSIDIGGVPVLLIDTAGLRETEDSIENLGIDRTRQAISDADLVLRIHDLSGNGHEQEAYDLQTPSIDVVNKCDLLGPTSVPASAELRVSALTGEGLDQLRNAILNFLKRASSNDEGLMITNARHHDLLKSAATEIDQAVTAINDRVGEELILVHLHNALRFLGQVTGETTTEDILSQVFATFCIGK